MLDEHDPRYSPAPPPKSPQTATPDNPLPVPAESPLPVLPFWAAPSAIGLVVGFFAALWAVIKLLAAGFGFDLPDLAFEGKGEEIKAALVTLAASAAGLWIFWQRLAPRFRLGVTRTPVIDMKK